MKYFPVLFAIVLTAGCQEESIRRAFPVEYDEGMKEKALNYANVLQEPDDGSPELARLGEKLFFDTRLSGNGTQSCATCHPPGAYGMDNNLLSAGANGQVLKRNTPTVLNAALHANQFWDGRAKTLEEQVKVAVMAPDELGMPSVRELEGRLKGDPDYQKLFAKAFPDQQEPVSFENTARAIAAFERTLITPSRFDHFLNGAEDALNDQEKRGLSLFADLSCIKCHSGNTLGGNVFQRFGLAGYYWDYTRSAQIDEGLFALTGNPADKYVFKVPSLRNVEKTAPYFHDGSVATLEEAIRIMAKVQLGMDLTAPEVNDIKAFLQSLTGAPTIGEP